MMSRDMPGSWQEKLTKEQIAERPLYRWHGPIKVIETVDEEHRALDSLSHESVLGFDTETRPAFRKGESYRPSILQLAGEGIVYLFLLKKLGLSKDMCRLLANPKILKTGVAIDRDLEDLRDMNSFEPGGFIDLGHAARAAGLQHHGLRGLAARVLDRRLSKSAQRTNWARLPLTDKQIAYAAADAVIGRDLYLAFHRAGLDLPVTDFSANET